MKKEKNYINQSIAISIGYLGIPLILGIIISLLCASISKKYDGIISIGSVVVSGLLLLLIYGRGEINKLKITKKLSSRNIMLLIIIGIGLGFASNLLYDGINYIVKTFGYSFKINSNLNTNFISFLYIVIIAPIFEELIFRKIMINRLKKYAILFALIASSFLFGVVHSYGIGNITTISCGLLLGYVYIKTGNIIYSMIIHSINNLTSFLGRFAINNNLTQLENIMNIFFYVMIVAGILCALIYIINIRKNKLKLLEETALENGLKIRPYKYFFTNLIIITTIIINIVMIILQLKKL